MEVTGEMSTDAKSPLGTPFNREDSTEKMNRETTIHHTQKKAGLYKTDQVSLIITCMKHDRTSGLQTPRQVQSALRAEMLHQGTRAKSILPTNLFL